MQGNTKSTLLWWFSSSFVMLGKTFVWDMFHFDTEFTDKCEPQLWLLVLKYLIRVFKVVPTTFWLKCINLPKYTKFCSVHNLEVAARNFGLLTKNCLMHWQIRGLKGSKSGNFCFVCLNVWTQILLVAIGAHMSYCYQFVLNNLCWR